MGRKKKDIIIKNKSVHKMSRDEKIALCNIYWDIFNAELQKIPTFEIFIDGFRRAEDAAEHYLTKLGYEVFRSRVKKGYRCVGAEIYWKEYKNKLSHHEEYIINKLKSILEYDDFQELAYAVKEKTGTPDLLVIKDDSIEFVEVKSNYETVKPPTVEFFIKYGHKWPLTILRVLR